MKTSFLPQCMQSLCALCCIVLVSVSTMNAQESKPSSSSTSSEISYPRSMWGYFFEAGSVTHNAYNADFNRWNFITVRSMQARGLSLHQGFLWKYMPSSENNIIIRAGWNTDFASFRERQSTTTEQLPWHLQYQFPNRNAETQARSINVEHDISMTLLHITLNASYRHRIASNLYMELGAESTVMFINRFNLYQRYEIRNGSDIETSGTLDNTVTNSSSGCPKTEPIPLENVSIPITLLGGVGIYIQDAMYLYARYHHPLTSFIPQHSWRTDRFTIGMELHLSNEALASL